MILPRSSASSAPCHEHTGNQSEGDTELFQLVAVAAVSEAMCVLRRSCFFFLCRSGLVAGAVGYHVDHLAARQFDGFDSNGLFVLLVCATTLISVAEPRLDTTHHPTDQPASLQSQRCAPLVVRLFQT